VFFLSRAVSSVAPLGQAVGVTLGGNHQSSADQIADRSVNVVEVMKQSAREGRRVDPALGVRCAENLVLELSELQAPGMIGPKSAVSVRTGRGLNNS
jgi:hypothetical protein